MSGTRKPPSQLCDWNIPENLNSAYRFYQRHRPSKANREKVRKLLEFIQENNICSVKRILTFSAKIDGYREFLFSIDELSFLIKKNYVSLVKVKPSRHVQGDILIVANMQAKQIVIGQTLVINQGVVLDGKSKFFKGKVVSEPSRDEEKYGNKLFYADIEIELPVELAGQIKPVAIHRLEPESKVINASVKSWKE